MKTRALLLCGLMTGSLSFCGAESTKEHLEKARSTYQQAVTQHGAQSPQAQKARQNLRAARKNYHTEIRKRGRKH